MKTMALAMARVSSQTRTNGFVSMAFLPSTFLFISTIMVGTNAKAGPRRKPRFSSEFRGFHPDARPFRPDTIVAPTKQPLFFCQASDKRKSLFCQVQGRGYTGGRRVFHSSREALMTMLTAALLALLLPQADKPQAEKPQEEA